MSSCRELQAVVHRSAWLWLQRIHLPSCHPRLHVPGMKDLVPIALCDLSSILTLRSNLETFGYREVTSRNTMELVASQFMATSLRMRTLPWNTLALAACPWPMLAPTPTVPSSSSAQIVLHGEQKNCEWPCVKTLLDPCCGVSCPVLTFPPRFLSARLDGKHVVFGQVVEGLDVVTKVESYGSNSGKPSAKITIANCGQL